MNESPAAWRRTKWNDRGPGRDGEPLDALTWKASSRFTQSPGLPDPVAASAAITTTPHASWQTTQMCFYDLQRCPDTQRTAAHYIILTHEPGRLNQNLASIRFISRWQAAVAPTSTTSPP